MLRGMWDVGIETLRGEARDCASLEYDARVGEVEGERGVCVTLVRTVAGAL